MNDNAAVEILLVEDEDSDAELAIRAFKKHKFINPIVRVRDGAEALDYLFCEGDFSKRDFKNRPKIILLDLKLPKVNGFDVLKAIKNDESLKLIPVIIMTSSQEEKDIVRSYELGVNSFIAKPVLMEDFISVVYNLGFYWLLVNKTSTD